MQNNRSNTNLTATRKLNGQFAKGHKPTNGFDKRPKDRSDGSWKKEQTARYVLEQMIRKTKSELEEIVEDTGAPVFQKDITRILLDENDSAYKRWKVLQDMISQIYGSPVQTTITNVPTEKKPFITGFCLPGRETQYIT